MNDGSEHSLVLKTARQLVVRARVGRSAAASGSVHGTGFGADGCAHPADRTVVGDEVLLRGTDRRSRRTRRGVPGSRLVLLLSSRRMPDANEHERAALDAVARRFSATWAAGRTPAEASLTLSGERIAVAFMTLDRHGTGQGSGARLGLRFDKVATRLMDRLRATLDDVVPEATTVLLTVTAPISKWSKTAAALDGKVRAILARGPSPRVQTDTVEGNRVHIRVVRDGSEPGPKLIAFAHHRETDALRLLSMANDWLGYRRARARLRHLGRASDRWLVVVSGAGSGVLEAYRSICSQAGLAGDFQKVVVVLGDGRVEVLTP